MKIEEKIDKYLNEGSNFFNKTVKKIAQMTDDNDHSGAIALGLELLGLDPEAKRARMMIAKIEKEGGYSPGSPIAKEKEKLYNLMMDTAKDELSPEDFKRFHGSF